MDLNIYNYFFVIYLVYIYKIFERATIKLTMLLVLLLLYLKKKKKKKERKKEEEEEVF
jgi:hypothetical protein